MAPSSPTPPATHIAHESTEPEIFPPDEEKTLLEESNTEKADANKGFASGEYNSAIQGYEKALASCPTYLEYDIAVLRSNIAACHLKLEEWKQAIESATQALEALNAIDPPASTAEKDGGADDTGEGKVEEIDNATEVRITALMRTGKTINDVHKLRTKALLRRAKARQQVGGWSSLQGALEDYQALSKPPHQLSTLDRKTVQVALRELPPRLDEAKNTELADMMGKLKQLGNGILKPFGLSTDNFQFTKDEASGGYSMNFDKGGKWSQVAPEEVGTPDQWAREQLPALHHLAQASGFGEFPHQSGRRGAMGRRPNQLILEFFERGPKLEDASNRYQHTCKSCGEKFPKGRIDSLTNHLVKKCPALPLRDRQRALLQIHELPDLPALAPPATGPMHAAQAMNMPFPPSKQGLSALETLAEVSRQHLNLSGKRAAPKQPQDPPAHQQHSQAHVGTIQDHHQGLFEEYLVHDDRPESELSALSQGLDMPHAPALPSIYQFNGPLHHSPTGSPHIGGMPIPSSAPMAHMVPSLVMAASAANDLLPLNTGGLALEPELNMHMNNTSMSVFQNRPGQWHNSIDPLLAEQANSKQHATIDENAPKKPSHPRPIAINPNGTQAHFGTDFSISHKSVKPKVRGRFTDTRRKEVQEVRKRGACIRCRMLKKPCSGDSPCSTCQNVESARLWKQPCIRTRIADEFNVYSAGLHAVLSFHAVSQAKGQIGLNQIPGRIEATHYPDSGIVATFTPLKCLTPTDIDPAILAAVTASSLEIIDTEDDISGKLDLYVKQVVPSFFESEDSNFMRSTINTACSVNSTNQDGLLTKVLELWNLTRILNSPSLHWHFFSNPSLAPTMAPPTITPSDLETINRTPISKAHNQLSYNLIKSQLMGATEKRAACLARTVMNDLERRLLQRQQANPFETFLVAVVLLACVERMCWLFRTWEEQHEQSSSSTGNTNQPSAEENFAQSQQSALSDDFGHSHRNPGWPLDKFPAYYSQQGERFSDILFMLLKMRGVPPRPEPRSTDGVLTIFGEAGHEQAREWYEAVGVTHERLAERRDARFVGEDPKEWELKYVGKIISGL
ncbi:hypothetical protein PMIN06_003165 [Paraphaeosphaeria minitans]